MTERPALQDFYNGVLLETCLDPGKSRPRVRPVELLPEDLRVEFPRKLREDHPLGTRFRADVRVCQKTNRKDGSARGALYLYALPDSIEFDQSHQPERSVLPYKVADRVYLYVELPAEARASTFDELRAAVYRAANESPGTSEGRTIARTRIDIIKRYALVRSQGLCEGCRTPAPFIAKNGDFYLEVHHIVALSEGGSDTPDNVAAVCPNCHRRVEFGEDAESFNSRIWAYVREKDTTLGDVAGVDGD